MPDNIVLPFSRSALIEIAMALSDAATSAYYDERLDTAARTYGHAATFYDAAGYACTSNDKRRLGNVAQTEAAEARLKVIEHVIEHVTRAAA
jgi:hypothetical protein